MFKYQLFQRRGMFTLKGRINKVERQSSWLGRKVYQWRIDIPGGLTKGRIWVDDVIKQQIDAELQVENILKGKNAQLRDAKAELRGLTIEVKNAKKENIAGSQQTIQMIETRIVKVQKIIELLKSNIKQILKERRSGENLLGANVSLYVESTKNTKIVKDTKSQKGKLAREAA
jgi:hypothetical protein